MILVALTVGGLCVGLMRGCVGARQSYVYLELAWAANVVSWPLCILDSHGWVLRGVLESWTNGWDWWSVYV